MIVIRNMIKVPAYFQGFSSKVDGSASLRFSTQELNSEDFATLQKHLNLFGWLMFAEENLEAVNIPKEEIHEDENKSPSKRLRATLFVLWKQCGSEGDFESFYKKKMEIFIDTVKTKLE